METDYSNALDWAANEEYPGHPMPTYYRQRIMGQLISQPRISAYHDILSVLDNTQYPTRQCRVAIQFNSMEIVGGLGKFDWWLRGIDVNTAASAVAAAAAAGEWWMVTVTVTVTVMMMMMMMMKMMTTLSVCNL